MALLEVRLDPIAQMRATVSKGIDPIAAAVLSEVAGADSVSITLSEKEDIVRMRDLYILQDVVNTRFNLNIMVTKRLVDRALEVSPAIVTLESPEGAIDSKIATSIREAISVLKNNRELAVAVRIPPESGQAKTVSRLGADYVEIDSRRFSAAVGYHDKIVEQEKIASVARAAFKYDLGNSVGGGLTYQSAADVADLDYIEVVSVGTALASRAVLSGFEGAVRDMLDIVR